MAGPISHIVFAKRFVAKRPEFLEREFIVGTSLPDIRYLARIPREETHYADTTLAEVMQAETSFQAGFLFHNYVDLERVKLVEAYVDPDAFPFPTAVGTALKILEDMQLATKVTNWPVIASYFDSVLTEELETDIAEGDLRAWHATIAGYISNGKVIAGMDEFLHSLYFTDQNIAELHENITYAREQKLVERYIDELNKF